MPKYNDQDVELLHDATPSDPGFNNKKDPVVIRLPDGLQTVVERSEVTDDSQSQAPLSAKPESKEEAKD